jgi:hypothetical protein
MGGGSCGVVLVEGVARIEGCHWEGGKIDGVRKALKGLLARNV